MRVVDAALQFKDSGFKVGIGIAGNAGRLWGACGDYKGGVITRQIRSDHTTQEESVVSNAVFTTSWTTKKRLDSIELKLNKSAGQEWSVEKKKWGLLNPDTPYDHYTHQMVNYTKGNNHHFKYYKAVSADTSICFESEDKRWDPRINMPVTLVVVAGPNNGCGGRDPATSSMTRTIDPLATDYTYFRSCVVSALAAMLDEMYVRGVQVALIPGVSCGIYAKEHKERIRGEFLTLIDEALIYGGDDRKRRFKHVLWVCT